MSPGSNEILLLFVLVGKKPSYCHFKDGWMPKLKDWYVQAFMLEKMMA